MHNDFHVTRGIFPLFEGLQVGDMEKILHRTGTPNGTPVNGTDSKKSTLNDLVEAAKSAASTVTNGLNGLKVTN